MRIAIASLLSDAPAPSFISKLPPELLVRIFFASDAIHEGDWESGHFSTQPVYSLQRAWVRRSIKLSHVCRKWRAVALSLKPLWDFPLFTLNDVQMDFDMMDRGLGTPLKLRVTDVDPESDKHREWCNMLQHRMPAVQSLETDSHESIVRLLLTNAPELKALCITHSVSQRLDQRGQTFHAPHLVTLAMRTGVGFPRNLLVNITRLHLETGQKIEDLEDINEIIELMGYTPKLQELHARFPGRDPWLRGDPPLSELKAPVPDVPELSTLYLTGNYTLATTLYRKLQVGDVPLTLTFDDDKKHVHESGSRAMRVFLREYTRAAYKPVSIRMSTVDVQDTKRASIEFIPINPSRKLVLNVSSTEYVSWGFSERILEMIQATNRESLAYLDIDSPYDFGSPLSFTNIGASMSTVEEIRVACPMLLSSFLDSLGGMTDARRWLHRLRKVTIAGAIILTDQEAVDRSRRLRKQDCILSRLVAPFSVRKEGGLPIECLVLEGCEIGIGCDDIVKDALAQWICEVDIQS
jgi:hypothetical protein